MVTKIRPKLHPKLPDEVLCLPGEGFSGIRAANQLLKEYGLVLKWRGSRRELGDRVYLRIRPLKEPTKEQK